MLAVYTYYILGQAWVTVYFGVGAWPYLYLDKLKFPRFLFIINPPFRGLSRC